MYELEGDRSSNVEDINIHVSLKASKSYGLTAKLLAVRHTIGARYCRKQRCRRYLMVADVRVCRCVTFYHTGTAPIPQAHREV